MRNKKYDSLKYIRYEQWFLQNVQDPLPFNLDAANKARQAGAQEDEVQAMSPSPAIIAASKASVVWKANTPCIDVQDVISALHIPNAARWRYDNGVPKTLTAAQAAFALDGWPDSAFDADDKLVIERTNSPTYGTIHPHRPTPKPLEIIVARSADQLIGSIAGRWRMLKHLAEADGFSRHKNVFMAACVVCGHQQALQFARAKRKPCKVCLAQSPVTATKTALRLSKPLTLWVVKGEDDKIGLILSEGVPEGATHRFDITHKSTAVPPTQLTPEERERAQALRTARKSLEEKLQTTDLAEAERQVIEKLAEDNPLTQLTYTPKVGRPRLFRLTSSIAKAEAQRARVDKGIAKERKQMLEEQERAQKRRGPVPVKLPTQAELTEELMQNEAEEKDKDTQVYTDLVEGLQLPNFDM